MTEYQLTFNYDESAVNIIDEYIDGKYIGQRFLKNNTNKYYCEDDILKCEIGSIKDKL